MRFRAGLARRGFFMDDLAHLIESGFEFHLGTFHGLLAQVDRIRQHLAAFLNGAGVSSILQIDSFGFKELPDVPKEFIAVDGIHALLMPETAERINYMQCTSLYPKTDDHPPACIQKITMEMILFIPTP